MSESEGRTSETQWIATATGDFRMKMGTSSYGFYGRIANHDAIWIIIDRLTKFTHFLPFNERFSLERLVQLYLKEIVVRHGVPMSIVSDRDP